MSWSEDETSFLIQNYPIMGKNWCVQKLNKTEAQIRQKASRLKLKARGKSLAWKNAIEKRKITITGKKRPKQSEAMKKKYENQVSPLVLWAKNNGKKISDCIKARIKTKGHPKGAQGLKHTEQTKKVISEKSKLMWANMTEAEKDARALRCSILGAKQTMNRANASWRAGWREIGGVKKYYRSRWEANYARFLEWQKVNNKILDWKHEPKTFWFEGIKRGCLSYLPDFWVLDAENNESYHEVKGWMDDRSKTKIKRMSKYHPNIKLIVIDTKLYKSLEKSMSCLISGWE